MIFYSNFDRRRTFSSAGFYVKKCPGTGLISEKTEVLLAERNERVEQPSFYNVFIMCCCYKSSEVLIKMFSS